MKKALLPLLLALFCLTAQAQTSGRFSIKGTVVDSSGTTLPGATIMLLLPKDSSLVNFGRTDEQGVLEFKNIKRIPHLLKISYVGYLPYEQLITPTDDAVFDAGKIQLKNLNQDLFEVVIKTARAPLSIRGDTVEYNASSFKVPPGSTVEDLLRKLPGMQVEQDGTIRAQGQEVQRVTVDGKRFFGGDVKMATKNLPAEAISKVQVFDGKSEQARLTGVDDGKKEKNLNLELKDSHKKGGFGKATVGAGTKERVEAKVSYNRFNDKQQFAIVGLGNNTNQTGLTWDDYQDFRGSQSFNWGDDGDFGFNNNDRFISFGDDESLTISPGGGQSNQGFTKNWVGGVNYNYDNKKTLFSSNYFFNQTDRVQDAFNQRESILSANSFRNEDRNSTGNLSANHRGGIRLEQKIDSLNTLVVVSNARFGNGNSSYISEQRFYRNNPVWSSSLPNLATRADIANANRFNSFSMGNTALYRHKFKKKGRNMAASVGYNINNSDGESSQRSRNEFYTDGQDPRIVNVNQNNETNSVRTQLKGSLLYLEPIAKKFTWETFYNFSLRQDEVDRDVFDVNEDNSTFVANEQLTRAYSNRFIYNRLGTSFRYANKGLNIMLGVAGLQFDLQGEFSQGQSNSTRSSIDRQFTRLTPNASLRYDLKNNRYLNVSYSMNVNEPSITDLQPIVDNSNPLYIREGNPNLVPQSYHRVSTGYQYFNPGSFVQFFGNIYYTYNVDQIVYSQEIDENLVTRSRPTNVTGGSNLGSYLNYGFPLKKTKSTLNLNTSLNFSKNLIFINDILNETNSNRYNFGTRLSLTPSDKFTFYGNADWSITNTRFSVNSQQDQKIINSSYSAEMNVKFPMDIFFSSRFNVNTYKNDQFGFNQVQPILNLSLYKVMLKSKKGEVRLSAYDVFNQNQGISQYASQNFVTTSQVSTLARYFMLSFTYNMRGVTASVRKNGYY
ncbi:TonB-dependent receptor family protein [Salmonirosea aquatica]|uniref:Outer membrane beta-barrel protein n=1 Tax=Salmonirosea aquatica TaxID=2654236 RepID=A0A7C9FTL5_9BACT|nr:outer membrane beta-barrel protein [Cytophagaceae bacterium SJW1-29]